ncbi:MAG: ATP-binding protein [Rhodospirillales bacterium]
MNAHLAPRVSIDPAENGMTDEAAELTAASILGVLDNPIIVLDARLTICYANMAAETFLRRAVRQLLSRPLSRVLPNSDQWLPVLELARDGGMKTSERGITIRFPYEGSDHVVDFNASPIGDSSGQLVVSLHETTVSHQVDRRMGFLGAAQSVTGMAAVLAHEIKNPLSGIRGASQLLESTIGDNDRSLTALIRSEVDRICGLVDRMTIPTQDVKMLESPVNIHEVLDRVQQLAQTGFGSHVHFVTHYDPSLPDVKGDQDLLIQAFLNLIKNAVEACPPKKGQIRLATAYRSGIGMTSPQDGARQKLGVEVTITDNGPGIDPSVRQRLFEPFITSKRNGSGLGLALTAKIISDLGGMIDCESLVESGGEGTMFRTLLPIYGKLARQVP